MKQKEQQHKSETPIKGERIAKVIARAGLGSRRQVEAWISEGRVRVNGSILISPALNVTDSDKISLDGKPIPGASRTRLWLYHKPRGLVVTRQDELGRATIFDYLPGDMPRVISIGRLDLDSEGLILLTNDGEYARSLEHPSSGMERRYKIRVYGRIPPTMVEDLAKGVVIDGLEYRPVEVVILDDHGGIQGRERNDNISNPADTHQAMRHRSSTNHWLQVTLWEGKNREIRRLMEVFGLSVSRLLRTGYGPFELGTLPRGAFREISPKIRK